MAGGTTPPIPNNAKNFDLEDKIRFVELAPSMQIRLETIRSDIEQTWGSGHFSKSFKKYNILGTSDTTDTKNAVTTNANKNKIDQKYDSSEISADRDDGDSWNITGIWKNIEQIWGTPNKGTINKHDHFKSPPTGEADYGINCIWDKLDDIDKRLTDVENLDGSSKIVETVKELQSTAKNMGGSEGNGGTYTPGGGSGITGGSSFSGGGSVTLLRTRTILTQTYWNKNWPYEDDLWVAFFTVLIDVYGGTWTYMDAYYKTPIIEGTNTGAGDKNEFDYYCTWPLRWDTAGDGNSDLISMNYLVEYHGNIGWSDFFLESNSVCRDGFHIYFDSVHETNKNPKVRLWINYQYYWHGNIDPFTKKPFTVF